MQFFSPLANEFEHLPPLIGQVIALSGLGASFWINFAAEPAIAFHALKQGIYGPGADIVPMSTEFMEHPLAHHRAFGCMMEDMDFPKAEQNFAVDYF
jgi:hypothetical protein